jgi:pimeloyl-ACP methyl ester carboxylesterase
VAVFLHGYPLNGYQWRDIIDRLSDMRRCVALDLMGAGHTRITPDQAVSYPAQARMIDAFLDALNIDRIDLVGNDSGSAVSQIFAARHAKRLRSLTLTNSVVHDYWPPPGETTATPATG